MLTSILRFNGLPANVAEKKDTDNCFTVGAKKIGRDIRAIIVHLAWIPSFSGTFYLGTDLAKKVSGNNAA